MNISCRPAVRHIPKGGSKTPRLMKHAYLWRNSHSIYISSIYIYNSVTQGTTLNFAKYNQRPQSISKGKPVHFLSTLDKGTPITGQPTTKVSKTDEVEEERINSPTN